MVSATLEFSFVNFMFVSCLNLVIDRIDKFQTVWMGFTLSLEQMKFKLFTPLTGKHVRFIGSVHTSVNHRAF